MALRGGARQPCLISLSTRYIRLILVLRQARDKHRKEYPTKEATRLFIPCVSIYAGKHVLCEKPFAASPEEVRRIMPFLLSYSP